MRIAPGPREDGRTCATVAATPRNPGYALGSRVDDTRRNVSLVSSTTSGFEAPATSWIYSQDVKVTLRCGYGNTGSSISSRALRPRSSRKTGWNLPLNTINEEGRNIDLLPGREVRLEVRVREHRILDIVPGAPLEVLTQDRSEPPAEHNQGRRPEYSHLRLSA